jgi:hypothetical protein
MKIARCLILSAVAVFMTAPLCASPSYAPFSLSLGLSARGAYGGRAELVFAGGIGASLYGDWRPANWISLGTGLSYTEFPGDKSWQVATWDVGVKLLPFRRGTYGEWYFQGTLGWNLVRHTLDTMTPGSYHVGWGLGYRVFLGSGMALDLCPGYDLYTPFHEASLHSLSVKAGMTWFLGGRNGAEEALKPHDRDHSTGSDRVEKL